MIIIIYTYNDNVRSSLKYLLTHRLKLFNFILNLISTSNTLKKHQEKYFLINLRFMISFGQNILSLNDIIFQNIIWLLINQQLAKVGLKRCNIKKTQFITKSIFSFFWWND